MDVNILERVDIPINDYNADTPKFAYNYFMDNKLSESEKKNLDNMNKSDHNAYPIKLVLIDSEHEPLFNSENMVDNNQQGDTIATIMNSDLWVPAKKHPQIAPTEFTNWIKQHIQEKEPEKVDNKSKLQRKKSHLSSVSYLPTESGGDSSSIEQQHTLNTESKHRSSQKSLLRRQVVHARRQGHRSLPVSAEESLHEITAYNQEIQDQLENISIKNTNRQRSVTHLECNETQVPTQQKKSSYTVPQRSSSPPPSLLSITDTFSKTEIESASVMDEKLQDKGVYMCAQKKAKTWSFADLFKKNNSKTSNHTTKSSSSVSFSRIFSKVSPNHNNQGGSRTFLKKKRSSLVKKKKMMPMPPFRNPSATSTLVESTEHLPLYVERAIYHLSHVKLANTKRPLCQQVVISNMMYWYFSTTRNQSHLPCATTNKSHFEQNHCYAYPYSDRFEPPRHHGEEEFPDYEDTSASVEAKKKKKAKKKQDKEKYKPVQNDQYNGGVL